MNEKDRKYDHSATGTYSIEEILSELDGKKASVQDNADILTQELLKTEKDKEACEEASIKEHSQSKMTSEAETESGHELWIGLGSENTEAKFDTNEYEPENFKELNTFDDGDISKTAVCEISEFKKVNGNSGFDLDSFSVGNIKDEEESIDDLKNDVARIKKAHILRLCFGIIPTALLIVLGFVSPDAVSLTAGQPWLASAVVVGLTLCMILIYILPVLRGFKALFAGSPNGDSGIALSAVASLILPVASFFFPDILSAAPVFGASASIGLLISSISGLLYSSSRAYALKFALEDGEKRALIPIESEQNCKELLGGMKFIGHSVYEPVRVDKITDLEESIYSCGLSDMSLRIMTLISLFGGIAVAVADYLLFGKSIPSALTVFVCFVMVSTALTAPIVSALPLYRASRHLSHFGSAITGCDAVADMTQIGSVVVDSNYLFPKNSVVLHGMRTFGSFRIDDAIIDAASVVCASNGALSGVFLGVIDNNRSLLRKVDTIIYEDGLGLSAWVSERRVLIGSAELLKNHDVDVPSRDYESKYRKNGRDLVYVSVAGELTAMFVVSYRVRREIYEEIRTLYRHKVGLIILNRDCNITEEKIAQHFRYPKNMIKILPPASEHVLGKPNHIEYPARIVYSKGIIGLVETIVTALRMSTTVNIANILQLGGSILGCVLIGYLTVIKGLSFFGLSELLLWQGVWGVLTLIVSLFRKP